MGCANTTDGGMVEPRREPGRVVDSVRIWLEERCEEERLKEDCGDGGPRLVDDRIEDR